MAYKFYIELVDSVVAIVTNDVIYMMIGADQVCQLTNGRGYGDTVASFMDFQMILDCLVLEKGCSNN